jgi:hypothetical protein
MTAASALLAQEAPVRTTSLLIVVMSGLLALVLSLIGWSLVRFALTLAHEGGHAFTASMMGGSVDSIHMYRQNTGKGWAETRFNGVGPFGLFFTALAGYLGPSVWGLLGAFLLVKQQASAVLWLSLFLLVLALIQAGNWLARLVTVVLGGLIVLMLHSASAGQQSFFAYTWVWLLLFGGFGQVLAFQHERRNGGDTGSDAVVLRTMTWLPASLWSGFFWLASLIALVVGAGILLHLVDLHQ